MAWSFLMRQKNILQKERRFLEKELTTLGFKYIGSDSNYLLVDISAKFKTSENALIELNKKDANAVNGDDFRGLGGKYLRLSPRLHEINVAFIDILKNIK